MKKKVTAIFDIGKTNKKFFLFDKDFQEVYREYARFEEIEDEDGYPSEDLLALQKWVVEVFDRILEDKKYKIKALNFTTYGASFVHLDKYGNPIMPFYNYNKILDQEVIDSFYEIYGPEEEFSKTTGTSNSGMLNSGMQLYWLKYNKPKIFKKIKYSLHFPQYLSYLFTGIPVSEFTSIGCHTSLWDYDKKDYHDWVYQEKINEILAPIVSTDTSIYKNYKGKHIKIGVGIHDSSAALIPYIRSTDKSFILVSTGTWSVTLNPFSNKNITNKETKNGCINYMRVDGSPVKSSRIYMGKQYQIMMKKMAKHFKVFDEYHKTVRFDQAIYNDILKDYEPIYFNDNLQETDVELSNLPYRYFEEAFHHFMIEIIQAQLDSIEMVKGNKRIKKLYVDGGFTDNDVFIQLLAHYLRDMDMRTTNSAFGTALGAAIVISPKKLNSQFLKMNYGLKKHVPFLVSSNNR
ncbi:FGGY-family carbohydrate kinase [Namhaeicola litoreus]|uniref:FGGY-family carbohydrate kinase n=1 Tax=Namhaeicola litoreus TaxID=1052145 RepID=A0ABW3Y3E2_9FLAO